MIEYTFAMNAFRHCTSSFATGPLRSCPEVGFS